MRKLLTGYVVNFNRRHRRSGHLFQNRYKSIVCEEDPYLLELTRYIHLNSLRAGIVEDCKELNRYPWAGHSALVGTVRREWQDTGAEGDAAVFAKGSGSGCFGEKGSGGGKIRESDLRSGGRGRRIAGSRRLFCQCNQSGCEVLPTASKEFDKKTTRIYGKVKLDIIVMIEREGIMKKGMPKKIYTYTERDIARVAGVSIGALRVAKARRKIVPNDLSSVSIYIIEHWLRTMQRKGKG
jgi:hypothetical protein